MPSKKQLSALIFCGLATALMIGWFPRSHATQLRDTQAPLAQLPKTFPREKAMQSVYRITTTDGQTRNTTINPKLQAHLSQFIEAKGNPVAAVVVLEAATGNILALAQGQNPKTWGSETHTALYSGFPAASLFKTVVSATAIEIAGLDGDSAFPLWGGCADVRRTGVWMRDDVVGRRHKMSLKRAYGQSCNGFFAKLVVNQLGLHSVVNFAKRFGWDQTIPADFLTESSPLGSPQPKSASVHTVGRFGAGFGYVGTSAVHAAWLTNAIANDGLTKPIRLFQDTPNHIHGPVSLNENYAQTSTQIISATTATKLRQISKATVQGGTASFAFRKGRHARLRYKVGGKTGTLSGKAPKGVNTWFAGYMPVEKPEVVVAAIVVLEDLWHIKGPNLAAEAFWAYQDLKKENSRIARRFKRNTR